MVFKREQGSKNDRPARTRHIDTPRRSLSSVVRVESDVERSNSAFISPPYPEGNPELQFFNRKGAHSPPFILPPTLTPSPRCTRARVSGFLSSLTHLTHTLPGTCCPRFSALQRTGQFVGNAPTSCCTHLLYQLPQSYSLSTQSYHSNTSL